MSMIQFVLAVFAVLGIIDAITGNHLKLGKEFEKGIMSMGSLVLAMVGMMTISPTLAKILLPVFEPISEVLHIDTGVIGSFFACDAGGAPMAYELSASSLWAGFHGIIVASMLGTTITLIPMSLNMVDKKYHDDVLYGLLCGIATIPVGCIVGGIVVGCPIFPLLLNLLPVILLSIVTCMGLLLNPNLCRKIFGIIGKLLLTILYIGLGASIFEQLTGIVVIPYMAPLSEAFDIVDNIVLILAGVFPLLSVISRVCNKFFVWLGGLIKIDDASVLGIITSLANCIPMFGLVDKMNKKGRIMNFAFIASAAFVFGDHMAFTMSFDQDFLIGMIVGKMVGGVMALIVAHFMYQNLVKKSSV